MHNSKVQLEPLALWTETTQKSINDRSIEIFRYNKEKHRFTNKRVWYRRTSRGENGQGSSSVNHLLLTRTNSPAEFLFELGRHDISRTRLSLVFK